MMGQIVPHLSWYYCKHTKTRNRYRRYDRIVGQQRWKVNVTKHKVDTLYARSCLDVEANVKLLTDWRPDIISTNDGVACAIRST